MNPQAFPQASLGSDKARSATAQTTGMAEPGLLAGRSGGAVSLPGEFFGRELNDLIGKLLTDSRRQGAKVPIDSRSAGHAGVGNWLPVEAAGRSRSRYEPAAGLAELRIREDNTERTGENDADSSRHETGGQPCGSCNGSSPVHPSSLRAGAGGDSAADGHSSELPRATARQTSDRPGGDKPASPDQPGAGPSSEVPPSENASSETGGAGEQEQAVAGENHRRSVKAQQQAPAAGESSAAETVGSGDEEIVQEVQLEEQALGGKPTGPATEAKPLEGDLAQVSEVPEGTEVPASANGRGTKAGEQSLAGAVDEAAKMGEVIRVSKAVGEAVPKPGGSAPAAAASPTAPDGTSAVSAPQAEMGQNGLGQSASQNPQQGLGDGFQQNSQARGQATLAAAGLTQAAKRFAEAIEMSRIRNEGEITLRLETKTLGEMQLKVSIANQVVHASILAEHETARAILSSQLGALQAALARQNLRLDGLSVAVGGDWALDGQAQQDDGPEEPRRQANGRSAGAIESSTSGDNARQRTVSLLQGGTLSILA